MAVEGSYNANNIADWIKERYEGVTYDLIEQESDLYSFFEVGTEKMEGSNWRIPLTLGEMPAGARSREMNLPAPGVRTVEYLEFSYAMAYITAHVHKDIEQLFLASHNAIMLRNQISKLMQDLARGAINYTNRVYIFDGTGARAKVKTQLAAGAQTTIELQNYFVTPNSTGATRYFVEGNRVSLYSSDWATCYARNVKVTAVNRSDGTLTVESFTLLQTVAAGSFVVVGSDDDGDSYGETSGGLDPKGFSYLFQFDQTGTTFTGNYFNKARTGWFYTPFRDSTAIDYSPDVAEELFYKPEDYGTGKVDMMFSNNLMKLAHKNYTDEKLTLTDFDLSYRDNSKTKKMLTYNLGDRSVPWKINRMIPDGWMIGINRSEWAMYELMKWQLDKDPTMWKAIPNTDRKMAYMKTYFQFACKNPRGQVAQQFEVDNTNTVQ